MNTFATFCILPDMVGDELYYPFSIDYQVSNDSLERINKNLESVYDWLYENVGDCTKWGVEKESITIINIEKMTIHFLFMNKEDLVAFKLRWL